MQMKALLTAMKFIVINFQYSPKPGAASLCCEKGETQHYGQYSKPGMCVCVCVCALHFVCLLALHVEPMADAPRPSCPSLYTGVTVTL